MKTLIHYLNGAESCIDIYDNRDPEHLGRIYQKFGYEVIDVIEIDTINIFSL